MVSSLLWNCFLDLRSFMPLIEWCDWDNIGMWLDCSCKRTLKVGTLLAVTSVDGIPWSNSQIIISWSNTWYKQNSCLSSPCSQWCPVASCRAIGKSVTGKICVVSVKTTLNQLSYMSLINYQSKEDSIKCCSTDWLLATIWTEQCDPLVIWN